MKYEHTLALQPRLREVPGSNLGLNTAILKDFCGFPQPLQTNTQIRPHIRPRLLTFTFLRIFYSLATPLFDAVRSVQLTRISINRYRINRYIISRLQSEQGHGFSFYTTIQRPAKYTNELAFIQHTNPHLVIFLPNCRI